MNNLTIHISRERMDKIRGMGYSLGTVSGEAAERMRARMAADPETTHFHLLDGERALCHDCGKEFDSIDANSPVDIENYKAQLASATQ